LIAYDDDDSVDDHVLEIRLIYRKRRACQKRPSIGEHWSVRCGQVVGGSRVK